MGLTAQTEKYLNIQKLVKAWKFTHKTPNTSRIPEFQLDGEVSYRNIKNNQIRFAGLPIPMTQ
jgi:hypothetical protein